MHIKTINTEGEYQCIIVGHNNLVRVDTRKRYVAIYLLWFFMFSLRMDSIYPGLNCCGSQELLQLVLRLILVVRQAAQYIAYDGTVAPTVILFVAFPDSTSWSSSLIYLLRCPALISFSTKKFRLRHLSISCP